MTSDELIAAGFKPFQPNIRMGDHWNTGYQLRVRDDVGTRYFIDVLKWDTASWEGFGRPDSYEVNLYFGNGCTFHPQAALKIQAYSGTSDWTVEDTVKFADELWQRLSPNYYERDC